MNDSIIITVAGCVAGVATVAVIVAVMVAQRLKVTVITNSHLLSMHGGAFVFPTIYAGKWNRGHWWHTPCLYRYGALSNSESHQILEELRAVEAVSSVRVFEAFRDDVVAEPPISGMRLDDWF